MRLHIHSLSLFAFASLGLIACAAEPVESAAEPLGTDGERVVSDVVKAVGESFGITNGLVLAGVANHEGAGMNQCWKDATWACWSSAGGFITSAPVVGRNNDGRLEVFARGDDAALWTAVQGCSNGCWGSFSSLGGSIRTF